MAFAHVFARVVVRATKSEGEEALLLGRLLLHVHAFEKTIDAFVGQNLAIENVHRGIHRCFAADTLVQTLTHITTSETKRTRPSLKDVFRMQD